MTPGGSASNAAAVAALQTQLDGLGERMDKGFDELKVLLRSYEERTRAIETREAGCQPIITARLDAAWRKLEEHDTKLTTKSQQILSLERQVEKMTGMYKTVVKLAWTVGIALLFAAGSLLFSLITHQALLVLK